MSGRRTGLNWSKSKSQSQSKSNILLEYRSNTTTNVGRNDNNNNTNNSNLVRGAATAPVSASSSNSYFGFGAVLNDKTPYLDLASVAPPPSRDYYRIYVTKSQVTLTQWRISHNPHSIPVELKIPLENFETDIRIPSEVNRVFGKDCVDYIVRLGRGHVDKIMHLPNNLLARIFLYVGIENLKGVAPVCRKFSEIAKSDELWKKFYFQYGGPEAETMETKHQADYLSWKSLFFINRLHFKIDNPIASERWAPNPTTSTNLNVNLNLSSIPNHYHQRLTGSNKTPVSSSPSSTSSSILSHSRTTGDGSRGGGSRSRKIGLVDGGIGSGPGVGVGTRESSSATRSSFLRRAGRIIDGNLVPRASATKLNEFGRTHSSTISHSNPNNNGNSLTSTAMYMNTNINMNMKSQGETERRGQGQGHGQGQGNSSPRQKATRYTVVQQPNNNNSNISTNATNRKNPSRKFAL